jgi:hypothetical protein
LQENTMRIGLNRHIDLFGILIALAALLATAPWAAAQSPRRWLAEPMLFTSPKTIGPSGNQLVADTISDIELSDGANGWATAAGGILRLENGVWRRFQPASGTTSLNAISAYPRSGMWIVGSETDRIPPYRSRALMLRYVDGAWQPQSDVARADGTVGQIAGLLTDVVVDPFGVWAIGAQPSDVESWQRPLVLRFDGTQWHDMTPAEWHYGRLTTLSLVGANPAEGWATGLLGRPGGAGADAVRPAVLHLQGQVWTEAPLPALPISSQPFNVYGVTMRDATEGWAIFYDAGTACGFGSLLHYSSGAWSLVASEALGNRSVMAIGLIPTTNRGWVSLGGCQARGQNLVPQRARFDNGSITVDTTGAQFAPSVYALLDGDNEWAAAGGALMRYSAGPLPTDQVPAPGPGERFFPETGHSLGGDFRSYYESHGLELGDSGITARESLSLFGYPVSQPFQEINPETGEPLLVQYFERARFELHPENPDPYRVLLGRLGFTSLFRQRAGAEPRIPNPDQSPTPADCDGFIETGYPLCAPFRAFWSHSGGLPVFGFPITGARDERNPTDSQTYQTQWFERERLEYHPELRSTPYEVLLGLLGAEELQVRGYLQ